MLTVLGNVTFMTSKVRRISVNCEVVIGNVLVESRGLRYQELF